MKLLDTTAKFYTPEEAVKIADEMNATDDWTYTPNNPDGSKGPYSKILITDEDGEEVGYL